MIVHNNLEESIYQTSLALGVFDGVHLGHKSVINSSVRGSKLYDEICEDVKANLLPTIFTFKDIPNVKSNSNCRIISLRESNYIFKQLGVKQVYYISFDEISFFSPLDFVENIIVKKLKAKRVYCGFNYHFGYKGKSTACDLKDLCRNKGIEVFISKPIKINDMIISSTQIKDLIKKGDIVTANCMLGRKFSFNYKVVQGRKLGRTMGIPTINQIFEDDMVIPRFGVYASAVNVQDKVFYGVTNIGVKPTVGSKTPIIETWMPDYNGKDLYGQNIRVELLDFIREERKFNNLEELAFEINLNAKTSKDIFIKLIDLN